MNDRYPDSDEPLIDGVGDLPSSAFDLPRADPGLEAAILRRTTAVVRGRRYRRRFALAAGLLIAYAVGFGSAHLWTGGEPSDPARDGPEATRSEDRTPDAGAAPRSPEAIEQEAEPAPPEERSRLLKLAGDRYLVDRGDVQGALRCYGRYLDLVSDAAAARPGPSDSWLLMELKNSRM